MQMKTRPEVHPILFSIAPALLFVSHNIEQTSPKDAAGVLGVSVLGTFLLWALLVCFLSDRKKVGMVVSVCLVLFFSFGHVYDALRYNSTIPILGQLARPRYMLLLWTSLFILFSYLIINILQFSQF